MNTKLAINVINSETLKPMLSEITSLVAGTIKSTFGPYGHSTLVQTLDSVYSTKDGWNVARNTRISTPDGEYSAAVNAIKKLILDVAQAVVLNAGDGTSTVMIGADVLNKEVSKYANEHKLDSRTVENMLNECVKLINKQLTKDAHRITDENMSDVIKRIALISTNWDEEVSDLIRDIYVKTKNPIIKVEDSGNQETYAEYTEGYDLTGSLQLTNYYINNLSDASFEADDPFVLIFAAPLGKKHTNPLCTLAQIIGKPVVVLAPNFDLDFLQVVNNMNAERIATGQERLNMVPCRYFANTPIDKDCVADMAALLGTTVLSTQYDKLYDALNVLGEKAVELQEKNNDFKRKNHGKAKPQTGQPITQDEVELRRLVAEQKQLIDSAAKEMKQLAGTCGHIKVNDKYILASGLTFKESDEFAKRKSNLTNLLEQKYKQYNAESAMTESIRSMRTRLGKMECNMGAIKVGGFGKAHIAARKDAIDDATRACEVAYTSGYILDGGLAIAKAAYKCMIANKENDEIDSYLKMFMEAFSEVCAIMYDNKYNDIAKSRSIVNTCIDKLSDDDKVENIAYNLVTEEYVDDLITPVDVCKEVVSGCLRLVLVNNTSNQFVFQNEDSLIRAIQQGSEINDAINESNKDDMEKDE